MNLLRRPVLCLCAVMAIVNCFAQQSSLLHLTGRIHEAANGAALPGAVVTFAQKKFLSVLTDSSGYFAFNLQAGRYIISLSHVGYKTKIISVILQRDTSIYITAVASATALQEVIVSAKDNYNKVLSTQLGAESIDRKTALILPAILGEVDIIKVLQLKPGVKNSGEGTSGISVRGGGTDQNLFLLDGSAVYNPNHLFGFFSTFNIDAIKDVQLYKAGFPAAFSGRLSSVVDVNTLKGADTTFSWGGGIGLIASRLNIQGNLLRKKSHRQKLTYNIAGRRTYADIFTSALNSANKNDTAYNPIPTYYFYDMNARIDWQLSGKDLVFGSYYHGRDYFKFDSEVFGSTFGWGNTAASIHWKHTYNNDIASDLSVHLSDYNYVLKSKFDRFDFQLGSGVKDYSLSHKFQYNAQKGHQISWGYQLNYNQFSIATFNINSTQAIEALSNGQKINGKEGGIYLADDWDVTDRLRLNTGARFTLFNNIKTYTGLEPRISLRYLLKDNLSVKASYSRMQQYKHLVASSGASLPTDIWYPSTKKIQPEIADQVSIGLTWNLNNKYLFINEGYYKKMRQLVDYKPGANLLVNGTLENEFVFGKGDSYGNEISIEKTTGKLRGWIGYTLAWTTRQFDAINNGRKFYPRYDRRHELSIVGSYPLSKRLTFSGSWTYYTGNAVSLPTGKTVGIDAPGTLNGNTLFSLAPVYPQRSNYRMPDYHRLDLGFVYKLRTRRGSADLTFSAYNAYSRLNTYFISFRANNSGTLGAPAGYTPKAVTLFPIIPSITYNFKF